MLSILKQASWLKVGLSLLAAVILFMYGAFVADYFYPPIPANPLDKLERIASDRFGWTTQAVLFPIALLATAGIFSWITLRLSGKAANWLASAATVFSFAGFLCWLPISIDRLELGAKAAAMIQDYEPASPPEVMSGFSITFWAHTWAVLLSIVLMGLALKQAGILPKLGWAVSVLAVAGLLTGTFVWHDWPPFMSYIILLIIATGLMRLGS